VEKLADKKKTGKSTVKTTLEINKKVNMETITGGEGNFIRNITAGTEYYRDIARIITEDLIAAAQGQKTGFEIKDEPKLQRIAAELGIKTDGRAKNKIALELGELILNEFGKQEGELLFLKRAPLKRQELWQKLGIAPGGIDHEISATKELNSTDTDPHSQKLMLHSAGCSLTNGWGSNMIAAELGDILSGTPSPTLINDDNAEMIAGFSPEAIIYSLGGSFRGSLHPLIDNIVNGRIRGIAGIYNCDSILNQRDDTQVILVKELIKNDVLVLFTGENAIDLAKAGLLVYEGAQYAGAGLHSVCEAVGLPPVLHMGRSVDTCRILVAASAIVQEAKLGDISNLPACIASPEGLNEKNTAIGQCFAGSGFFIISGDSRPTNESNKVTDFLLKDMENIFGGMWDFEADPLQMAQKMIGHIDRKRKELGIDKARDRILYDMAMRRELV
jgi:hydroxylamine reductase (hybrid-cluster protein)